HAEAVRNCAADAHELTPSPASKSRRNSAGRAHAAHSAAAADNSAARGPDHHRAAAAWTVTVRRVVSGAVQLVARVQRRHSSYTIVFSPPTIWIFSGGAMA